MDTRSVGAGSVPLIGRRVDAWCIDLFLYLLFVLVVGHLMGGDHFLFHADASGSPVADHYCTVWNEHHLGACVTQAVIDRDPNNGDMQATTWEVGPQMILVGIGPFIAFVVFQGLVGASPGKLAMRLRVVDREGRLAGVWASALRSSCWAIDAFPSGFPAIGGLLMIRTDGNRRVGDMVAGTRVVDRSSVVPASNETDPTPVLHPAPGTDPPTDTGV